MKMPAQILELNPDENMWAATERAPAEAKRTLECVRSWSPAQDEVTSTPVVLRDGGYTNKY